MAARRRSAAARSTSIPRWSTGVVRVGTIIADNVVGSNYTPGAGNLW
jgi:hypothetical protein